MFGQVVRACNQCGKCCKAYSDGGLVATAEEVDEWADVRPDIAAYVHKGEIWFDPNSGERLKVCPWLEELPGEKRYGCGIYAWRPQDCRDYPVDVSQMVVDGCEMLEPRDLRDHARSQVRLDNLLSR